MEPDAWVSGEPVWASKLYTSHPVLTSSLPVLYVVHSIRQIRDSDQLTSRPSSTVLVHWFIGAINAPAN